jgi:hypothetical protein
MRCNQAAIRRKKMKVQITKAAGTIDIVADEGPAKGLIVATLPDGAADFVIYKMGPLMTLKIVGVLPMDWLPNIPVTPAEARMIAAAPVPDRPL